MAGCEIQERFYIKKAPILQYFFTLSLILIAGMLLFNVTNKLHLRKINI